MLPLLREMIGFTAPAPDGAGGRGSHGSRIRGEEPTPPSLAPRAGRPRLVERASDESIRKLADAPVHPAQNFGIAARDLPQPRNYRLAMHPAAVHHAERTEYRYDDLAVEREC